MKWTARVAQLFDRVNVAFAHLPFRVVGAVVAVVVLYLLYWVTHRRVRGVMRRLLLSAVTAAVLAGAVVAWVATARQAKLAANSAATRMPVPEMLTWGWAVGFAVGTVLVFLLASWFVRARGGVPARVGRRMPRGGLS